MDRRTDAVASDGEFHSGRFQMSLAVWLTYMPFTLGKILFYLPTDTCQDQKLLFRALGIQTHIINCLRNYSATRNLTVHKGENQKEQTALEIISTHPIQIKVSSTENVFLL